MRQIKFRGKRLDNGEWVEGDLVHGQGTKAGRMYILPHAAVYPPGCHKIYGWNVDPATVGQFTGLTDKNGKEIWEQDIIFIRHPWKSRVYRGEIIYDKGKFCAVRFHFPHQDNPEDPFENIEYMEVIGNAIDNKELLTK